MKTANDNTRQLVCTIDQAIAGQAITIAQPHRKFGSAYAEFVSHSGNGRDIMVRKLISSTWSARWTKPLTVPRSLVLSVHPRLAREV